MNLDVYLVFIGMQNFLSCKTTKPHSNILCSWIHSGEPPRINIKIDDGATSLAAYMDIYSGSKFKVSHEDRIKHFRERAIHNITNWNRWANEENVKEMIDEVFNDLLIDNSTVWDQVTTFERSLGIPYEFGKIPYKKKKKKSTKKRRKPRRKQRRKPCKTVRECKKKLSSLKKKLKKLTRKKKKGSRKKHK